MRQEIDIAFALVRSALTGTDECSAATQSLSTQEWWSLFRLLQRNHVAALCFDAVSKAGAPRDVMMPWLAEREKAVEWHRYQQEVQQDIVGVMKQHGIETLVLKGTHTAQYYPRPELREFGDLDLYFYDKHDEADRVASEMLKVTVSNDAHHHSKYNYRGVTVESHYDFVNRHYPPSNHRYEALLKKLVGTKNVSSHDDKLAENISIFNFHFSTFEVLFLLRHMAGHFAASRITLRDLVDWVLTCHTLNDKVDWVLVQDTVKQYGMEPFVSALNTIAEQRLGIDCGHFQFSTFNFQLVEHDIVYGSVDDHTDDGIGRLGWKLRRWRALGWKRKMVYSDNNLRLLLSSLTSHATKPQSILHKM